MKTLQLDLGSCTHSFSKPRIHYWRHANAEWCHEKVTIQAKIMSMTLSCQCFQFSNSIVSTTGSLVAITCLFSGRFPTISLVSLSSSPEKAAVSKLGCKAFVTKKPEAGGEAVSQHCNAKTFPSSKGSKEKYEDGACYSIILIPF